MTPIYRPRWWPAVLPAAEDSYRLSRRQEKEIYDRGTQLTIALPPPDEPWVYTGNGTGPARDMRTGPAMVYAQRVLRVPTGYMREAWLGETRVIGCPGGSATQRLLGSITPRGELATVVLVAVRVGRAGHVERGHHWPGDMRVGGRWLSEEED